MSDPERPNPHPEAQLGLFGDAPAPANAHAPAPAREKELVVCRDRGHILEHRPGPSRRVWTMRDFFDRVRELAFDDESAVLDDSALMWASAAALLQGSPWSVRIAPDVAQLARALVHAGADAGEVQRAIGGQGGRMAEIGGTFHAIARAQDALQRAGVIDSATALAKGTAAIERGQVPLSLRAFSRVIIAGLVDPSAMELRALVALARAGLPLTVVLPRDDAGRGLAEATNWILDALESAHDAPALDVVFAPIERGAAKEFLDAWYQPQLVAPKDAPVRVEILSDPASEARRIASLCARWRRESDGRIAIGLRSLDAHADRIADALTTMGLSVRRRRGRPLAQTSAGRTLLDLVTVRRDGAPRDRVLSVLAQPAFAHHLPCDEVGALASTLRRAVARTDVEDATRPEGGYRHRLERTAALDREMGSDAKAAAADVAMERVQTVLDAAKRLPRRGSLRAYLTHTLALVDDFMIPDAKGEVGALVELLERWRRAIGRVDVGAPKALDRETELPAFARFLSRGLWERYLPPDPVDDDGAIEILSLPEMMGRTFDHVVIADCVHGRLPLAERSDPLLSDSDRASLNQAMGRRVLRLSENDLLEPGPLPARQALEPLWFASAVGAATTSVFLSAAAQDAKGEDLAPSVFIEEALIALGELPDAKSAGPKFEGDPHPRDVRVRAVHHLVQPGGAAAVVPFLHPSDIALARTCLQMRLERENFFSRGGDPKDAAPYAFYVDPHRMERCFGDRLGLLPNKPLTPTRLEALATCRFRGFVTQLLRVDIEREAGQDGDARQLGTLAHEVLEVFFRRRKESKTPVTRMTRDDERDLRDLVDELAQPLREGKTVGHLAALDANIRWLSSALVRTVTTLARHPPVDGAEPVAFEVAVGLPGQDTADFHFGPVPLQLSKNKLFFGGVIDRVDRGRTSRVVIDYKNSTSAAIKRKLWGDKVNNSHFQLPLYLRLLEANLPSDARRKLFAYLVSLRDGTVSDVLGDREEFRPRVMDDTRPDGLVQGLDRVLTPLLEGKIVADEGFQCSQCRCARACRLPPNALAPGLIDDGYSALPMIDQADLTFDPDGVGEVEFDLGEGDDA